MRSSIGLIVEREYLERVTKKSFIITTILVPLVMVAIMLLPALLMTMSEPDKATFAVIDNTEVLSQHFENSEAVSFDIIGDTLEAAKNDNRFAGVIVLGRNAINRPTDISVYTHDAPNMEQESHIRSQIKNAVETERLKAYNIENLNTILEEINANVSLNIYRIDKDGEEESVMNSTASFMLGIAIAFILYMFLLIYGQLVMTSIIEEKNNRVLEIVVSSVRPEQLMLGKIAGIGLVALTQIILWGVILIVCTTAILPMVLPADLMSDITAVNSGSFTSAQSGTDMEDLQTIAMFADIRFLCTVFGWMLLFIIGGFFLYSSIYAAIGSAVDNIQDASQLQTVATLPIILGMVFTSFVASDPNSTASFWLSMVPFLSPILMMIRIPFGVPVWEILLSVVLLYAGFMFMVWFAAKIYRVGIFMYGKKPSVKELIKWARYK